MPLASGFVPGPVVKVDGAAVAATVADRLVDLRVEAATGIPSRCILRFDDADFALLDKGPFAIGGAVLVGFAATSSTVVDVFDGEVVSLGVEQGAHDRHELVVTAYDLAHRLTSSTQVRTWQNKTYADLVKTIAGEAGLSATVTISPDPQHLYLVQTGTDAALLDDLAARTGCEWRVEAKKLIFGARAAPASPVKLTFGENLVAFRATYSAADSASNVTVRSWDPMKKEAIVSKKAPADATMHASTAKLATEGEKGTSTFGTRDLLTGAIGVSSRAEADAVAAGLASRAAAATFTARGELLLDPKVVPGGAVEVAGMGTKLAGVYRVSSVEHIFGAGQSAVTRFTVHGHEPPSLAGLLGPRRGLPEPWGRTGFTVGIVSNNNDPEGLGRVRVKFPTLSDSDESAWARIVSLGQGPQRGLMMMPQINDEVLVGFEQGDLRRPFVLGTLWNGKDKPPSTKFLNGQNVVEWMLKTKGGIVMTFREGAPGERPNVVIALADNGTKLYLGEDKVEIWAKQTPLEVKSGDATVTLDGKGNLELKGTKIVLKATGDLEMSATNVKVKASTQLSLEGTTLNAKASGSGKVESSGVLELKGSLLKIN